MTRRYCFALDLKDDPALIAEYIHHHRHVWPEVVRSLKDAGVEDMEIYLHGHRLFMVMDVGPGFSLTAKAEADRANPRVQEWETLMWTFQQALPGTKPGEKWQRMEQIFKLE